MARESRDDRRLRFVLGGAAVGVALGILIALTTDVPLAPEGGLVLGAVAGWMWRQRTRR